MLKVYSTDTHEYEYVYEDGSLSRSYSEVWSEHCRGEQVSSVEQKGDYYYISAGDYQPIQLDASQLCDLYIVLACLLHENPNIIGQFELHELKKVKDI